MAIHRDTVALARVPALALAPECDAAWLLRLALPQTVGDNTGKAIIIIRGKPITGAECLDFRLISPPPLGRE